MVSELPSSGRTAAVVPTSRELAKLDPFIWFRDLLSRITNTPSSGSNNFRIAGPASLSQSEATLGGVHILLLIMLYDRERHSGTAYPA